MINLVKVWINAFIPVNVSDNITISTGDFKGQTAIKGPTSTLFLTDNRSFDFDVNTKARMQSVLTLDFSGFGVELNHSARCSRTSEINAVTGKIICQKIGDSSNLRIRNFLEYCIDGNYIITGRFVGSANNPCISGSPDIDWNIGMKLILNESRSKVSIEVSGVVEPFPAFEMYAKTNRHHAKRIFNIEPSPGKNPWDLWGGPTKNVSYNVEF
ncbi:MAG: hypothetical protein MI974_31810 [Chitinophagales bacterium]|nr:hypothetical protein [Chitinophagales bacterium]